MPTKQPPTRAQDLGKCAWAALPEVINLAPVSTSWFSRSGKWADKQGAIHVSWEENRFRIDYTNVDYYVDLKPWFHAKLLKNPDVELSHMRIWLPEPKKHRAMVTMVYMDCEGTPMYVSREFKSGDYEIFNHIGQLVATGGPAEMVPGQLYFKDPKGRAFAIAGSPTIAQVATGYTEVLPQDDLYDFDHWQVWYMEGFGSTSYLKDAEHRWVVAAVVQEHAIFNTLTHNPSGSQGISTPSQYIVFMGVIVLTCLGIASLCFYSCLNIFQMVYPPRKVIKGNPFMVEDIGGPGYGTANVQQPGPQTGSFGPPPGHPFASQPFGSLPPTSQAFGPPP